MTSYAPFDYKENAEYKTETDTLWADGYRDGFRGSAYQNRSTTQDRKMFYRNGYSIGASVRKVAN